MVLKYTCAHCEGTFEDSGEHMALCARRREDVEALKAGLSYEDVQLLRQSRFSVPGTITNPYQRYGWGS